MVSITFDGMIQAWPYEYRSKTRYSAPDGSEHYMFVYGDDYDEFVEELKRQGLYEEYQEQHQKQLSLFEEE